MSALQNRYSSIDWERLLKKLWAAAVRLTRGTDLVIVSGVSADDLVQETLQAHFRKPEVWQPAKGSLETFLLTALRNRFIDHVRKAKRVAGSYDDENFSNSAEGRHSQAVAADRQWESDRFMDTLHRKLEGHQDLQDLVAALSMTDGMGNRNQQAAGLLGVEASDVVNLKKKLLRHKAAGPMLKQQAIAKGMV